MVPANHGLGANDMERLAPPSPLVGEPHPEETLEAPELRSLRPAKQDELLPQRQVLESEVSAGSERRTQRAQQSDYEGHCLSGSHAAGSSSRILANDNSPRAGGAPKPCSSPSPALCYNAQLPGVPQPRLVTFAQLPFERVETYPLGNENWHCGDSLSLASIQAGLIGRKNAS